MPVDRLHHAHFSEDNQAAALRGLHRRRRHAHAAVLIGVAVATMITLIWWLYGNRLWKKARREGNFAFILSKSEARGITCR